MTEPVHVERRGNAAILTIDREDRRNALSRDTLLAFGRLGRELSADPSVRAIVITGRGDKAFCAGADLKERQGYSDDDVRRQVGLYRTELGVLDRCPKPVVAALNGVAFGGGLELALICDLRVAAAHAEVALPETGLGIIPGAGGTQRLPRAVGKSKAMDMLLTARMMDAAEAERAGQVSRVVPADKLIDEALAAAETINGFSGPSAMLIKELVNLAFQGPLTDGVAIERRYFHALFGSDDQREGMSAFLEKRAPGFKHS